MTRSALAASFFFATAVWGFAACSGDDGDGDTFCDKGTVTYCRCRGGDPGTRQCNEDGSDFDACISDDTLEECEEIPISPTETDTGTDTGTGTGGAGGGGSGSKALFEACVEPGECKSGNCGMGFCTQPCASWEECVDGTIQGECTTPPGFGATCVPYCVDQSDCDVYGPPSVCGYGLATDGFSIIVCADWGAELSLPPEGWECVGDLDCNLGHPGVERICLFEQCTTGCFAQTDCPASTTCSASGGNPGTCN